jgi:glyoxylase-like metal-dependent hydrolase (beta-lactamase superfamily II)
LQEHAVATPETYEILALKYGEFVNRKRYESFISADDHDLPHPIDYFVWVIRNAKRTILVDCGFDQAEGTKRGRVVSRTPAQALEMIGVSAANLSDLIVTHLHYDHAGTLGAFPKARFHLQAAEMAYATGPCMCHAHLRYPFTADHVCEMVKNLYSGRVMFHDGDAEVAPGVTVHKIGGHSRGLQAVRVMTQTGPVMLASDSSHFYENFEKGKVFPIVVDVENTLKGYARLRELAASPRHIVPGHDPLVLKRYPALNSQTQGVVHRLDVARLDQ